MTLSVWHNSHKGLLPHWLIHFGLLGIFVVATIDASVIPLPLPGSSDLLVLLLTAHRGNPWLATLAGTLGSLVGGYSTWTAGKSGGEAMLKRYGSDRLLRRIERWMKRNGMLTVAVASILPPPLPLMPFLLSAGALGMSRTRYMIALGVARAARYGLIAWLGATYGRTVLRAWSHYMAGWADGIMWAFTALVIAVALYGVWRHKSNQHTGKSRPSGKKPTKKVAI
ncbi:MAG TPA: VTT domain-containing protein [Acidobacteriaceae bacterium]|nr:VTT domain-containing protein [Acidobacteriaceae bacterium]